MYIHTRVLNQADTGLEIGHHTSDVRYQGKLHMSLIAFQITT